MEKEGLRLKLGGLIPANPLRLVLSGERGSGKASIFYRLKAGNDIPLSKMRKDTKHYLNTYGGRLYIPPIYIPLKLKDSTYYLDFKLLRNLFPFHQMSGIVYCVDSSKRKSMRMACESLHDLLKRRHHDKGIPLLVFANKQDIKGAMTPEEVEDALHLHSIKDRPYRVVGCSAVSGEGLKEGLEWLVKSCDTTKKMEYMEGPVKETLEGPVKETLEGPVKETWEDGKAVLKSGQSWLSSFITNPGIPQFFN